MKRILLVCLLGMAVLLPSTQIVAKAFYKRAIDVHLEDYILYATSDAETGIVKEIVVYNTNNDVVLDYKACGTYSCHVGVSSLGTGTYRAHVIAAKATYDEYFVI